MKREEKFTGGSEMKTGDSEMETRNSEKWCEFGKSEKYFTKKIHFSIEYTE